MEPSSGVSPQLIAWETLARFMVKAAPGEEADKPPSLNSPDALLAFAVK
jgi:hypothetical protein